LFAWLRANGREDVIADLSYRQLTAAVVSDACHFLCESLLASGKGKTVVAYSLLRKPLKENLLLLEWLAADPVGFLVRFNGESDGAYVLNRLSPKERRSIIAAAVAAVATPGIDEELLWLIRYDKESPNSLETLWTRATHLVTTVQASRTEPGNLNFVFSTESDVEDQWAHYYRIVPLLLFYFVALAEHVAARFVNWEEDPRQTQLMLRNLAFLRYCGSAVGTEAMTQAARDAAQDIADLLFPCASCAMDRAPSPAHIDHLWLRGELICDECGQATSLWDLIQPDSPPAGT
jgi:hypothetical protein